MGTYDLEKEIYRILQDSSKIRGYNARLRSEYININDENRRLKIENSKLISQNACTEISLAKAEADNFAKSEEVKSLQSVINLLAPEYSNRSDSHVKSGGEKHDGLEDSGASSLIDISDTALQEKSSVDSKTGLDKLLPYILPFSIILFLLIAIMWFIIVKKLRNTQKTAEQYIQTRDWHLQRLAVRSEAGRKKNDRYT
ncbi:hypothetical protein RhiirC2_796560 [Rhizophagus irregularis]|uniref:Uncharacterized protein n=1 Tax=Rhizophagus irregularis TaxID=588596 RepID=A0A2N1M9I4_9GLOM|nr:hypothetical protein RhiirC2_796560 [Rhizophagus irregularis]